MDWTVQEIRLKKLKPKKKDRKKKEKVESKTCNEENQGSATQVSKLDSNGDGANHVDNELLEDNNIEEVEGLRNSKNLFQTIPSAEDVLHKRRQNLSGYPM